MPRGALRFYNGTLLFEQGQGGLKARRRVHVALGVTDAHHEDLPPKKFEEDGARGCGWHLRRYASLHDILFVFLFFNIIFPLLLEQQSSQDEGRLAPPASPSSSTSRGSSNSGKRRKRETKSASSRNLDLDETKKTAKSRRRRERLLRSRNHHPHPLSRATAAFIVVVREWTTMNNRAPPSTSRQPPELTAPTEAWTGVPPSRPSRLCRTSPFVAREEGEEKEAGEEEEEGGEWWTGTT